MFLSLCREPFADGQAETTEDNPEQPLHHLGRDAHGTHHSINTSANKIRSQSDESGDPLAAVIAVDIPEGRCCPW